MQDTAPRKPDGNFDYKQMAEDPGIADPDDTSCVFITDNTGVVHRVATCDEGTVRLRDGTTGREYATPLSSVWSDWRWDDLIFVDRAFLHHNELGSSRLCLR